MRSRSVISKASPVLRVDADGAVERGDVIVHAHAADENTCTGGAIGSLAHVQVGDGLGDSIKAADTHFFKSRLVVGDQRDRGILQRILALLRGYGNFLQGKTRLRRHSMAEKRGKSSSQQADRFQWQCVTGRIRHGR
jgi:hypothetical protein